ncbi:hypothetical protein FJY84_03325 [Candidatus Bathyarchaeota archaeon]|nr:hypothetical protein [Candidatus Bathyarchaeota archaeon]
MDKNNGVKPPSRFLEPVQSSKLIERVEGITDIVYHLIESQIEKDGLDRFIDSCKKKRNKEFTLEKNSHAKMLKDHAIFIDAENRTKQKFVQKVCEENLIPLANGQPFKDWTDVKKYETAFGDIRLEANELVINHPNEWRVTYEECKKHLIETYGSFTGFSFRKTLKTENGRGSISVEISFGVK